ncbi:MAG TPA: hypothetical protein VIK65_10905 [Candidatus Limnocylindrales bacterium]|jgi:uncharacterized membrane protein YeaQ/YmgE (transglycosylase-associated protein family)
MEFTISLGIGGWILLVGGALVVGVIAQFVGAPRTGYEWLITAVAAGVGALFVSEFVTAWRTFEPVFDGLALVPALVGGLVVGVIADMLTRYSTGGTYSGRSLSA